MDKYANQYLDKLKEKFDEYSPIVKEQIKAYKPFNQGDANTTGAALGAGLGAVAGGGIGALSGLVSDPGYDEQGQRKSRIKASLKGLIGGGAIGAGAGALGSVALSTLGRGAIDLKSTLLKAELPKDSMSNRFLSSLARPMIDLSGAVKKKILPHVAVKDLMEGKILNLMAQKY